MKTTTKIYLLLLIAALGGLLYFFFPTSRGGGETEAGRLAELPAAKAEITTEEAEAEEIPLPGLTVKQGRLLLDGRPYRGMGINYAQCFWHLLRDPENRDFVEGFRILGEDYQIPFIRFAACGYFGKEWELYAENPEEYFRLMDLIIREAEKRKLGLIPSLFWAKAAVGDWCQEPLGEISNRESKTRAFYRKYAAEFVNRYKDSPAIWGWEIGNEYLLGADLPGLIGLQKLEPGATEPRTAADKLTTPGILDLYVELYQIIRGIDPHRIIVTGEAMPRKGAWNILNRDDFGLDTREQWLEVFLMVTPAPYSVYSVHFYPGNKDYFEGEEIGLEELLQVVVTEAHRKGGVVWVGEFGAALRDRPYGPAEEEMVRKMFRVIKDTGVELSAPWNFSPPGVEFQPTHDITPANERAWFLSEIAAFNRDVSPEPSSP